MGVKRKQKKKKTGNQAGPSTSETKNGKTVCGCLNTGLRQFGTPKKLSQMVRFPSHLFVGFDKQNFHFSE